MSEKPDSTGGNILVMSAILDRRRNDFEAKHKERYGSTSQFDCKTGRYESLLQQDRWEMWQAASGMQ